MNDNRQEIEYLLTMNYAFSLLESGTISCDEYEEFLALMHEKYGIENIRILYQSKLDIVRNKSVNSDTKGENINGNYSTSFKEEENR